MTYEAWRISFQSSEQAARSAWEEAVRYRENDFAQRAEISTLRAENAKLREQLAACQRDAGRYRMARSGMCDIELCEFDRNDGEFYGLSMLKADYADQQLDAAIDAQKGEK